MLAPVVQHFCQLGGKLGFLLSKIFALTDVLTQVVELYFACFKNLDEFVVTSTHGTGGSHGVDVMVMGIVKVDRLSIQRCLTTT